MKNNHSIGNNKYNEGSKPLSVDHSSVVDNNDNTFHGRKWIRGNLAIRTYMGMRGSGSLQRWKKLYGLPIYNLPDGQTAALKNELDDWLHLFNFLLDKVGGYHYIKQIRNRRIVYNEHTFNRSKHKHDDIIYYTVPSFPQPGRKK